jgi:ApaG protein
METAVTKGIKVSVIAEFQPFYSDPEQNNFAFSYKIKIENNSESTFKLLKRHWYIWDSIGSSIEVIGDGVVGIQPIIEPGNFHEYVSGCNFKSTIGKMYGFYTMERLLDGKTFLIAIPEFVLTVPYILN